MRMSYLVTGATGNVGAELVSALVSAGQHVRALSRAGDRRGMPPGVEVLRGDLDDPASLAGPLDGVEGLFLLPGFRDMPGILEQVGWPECAEWCCSPADRPAAAI